MHISVVSGSSTDNDPKNYPRQVIARCIEELKSNGELANLKEHVAEMKSNKMDFTKTSRQGMNTNKSIMGVNTVVAA